jgi:excisionase family DNA binding protein
MQRIDAVDWGNLPPLLLSDEVARILRLTPTYVRALAAKGEIRALRLGAKGDWRFTKEAVQAYLCGNG